MRPSDESLLADYIADLEVEIECNARERANGRTDLDAYDAECKAKLERLRNATVVRFDRFGQPVIIEPREDRFTVGPGDLEIEGDR